MPLIMHDRPELPAGRPLRSRLVQIQSLDEPIRTRYGGGLRFIFQLADPPHAGRVVSVLTSARLEQGNRLHGLLQQMGLNAEVGQKVPVETLIGQLFIVKLTAFRNGYQNVAEVVPR